jgi:hypothetical protein
MEIIHSLFLIIQPFEQRILIDLLPVSYPSLGSKEQTTLFYPHVVFFHKHKLVEHILEYKIKERE